MLQLGVPIFKEGLVQTAHINCRAATEMGHAEVADYPSC